MRICVRLTLSIAVLCLVSLAIGDEGDKEQQTTKPTSLGIRQARVEQKMLEIDRRFKELVQALDESEPERAKRLNETLGRAGELNVKNRLKMITDNLNGLQLDKATKEQEEILVDIRELIQLLLDEQSKELDDEAKALERYRQEIKKIIDEEKRQKRETDKIADKDKSLADLEAQIQAVKKLIQKQTGVNSEMDGARKVGPQAFRKVADDQHKVRKETDEVAKAIGQAAGQGQEGSQGSEGGAKGSEGGSKGSEGGAKGSEGGAKGSEGGSKGSEGGSKGSEGGAKGSEGGAKGSEDGSKGSEGSKPSSQDQPKEPGQRQLENASKHQESAEGGLQDGKSSQAKEEGEKALDDLKSALADLENERRRIASLPPEALDEMADKQDKTSDKVAKLEEEMEKDASKGGSQGSGSSEGQGGGKKKPGQPQVQQAQKNMKQASGDLREKDPEGASRQQDEAIRQLEKALQEIEQRLAQLREETQEEKLARLEARFVEMLARQEVVTRETKTLDQKKQGAGELLRADRLAIAKLGVDERELAEMAQQAYDILVEDGTSVVFPSIVEGLRDDLSHVAELLEAQQTGDYTQYVQSEIETTLKELIDALKKLQKQKKEGGGGGGGGGGGEPSLLPNSAELKLLKSAQLRVNRRTKAFDINRPKGTLDDILKKEVRDIGLRQLEIAIMTEQIIERSMNVPLQ